MHLLPPITGGAVRFFFICILCLLVRNSFSQSIRGNVYNTINGRPLSGAIIICGKDSTFTFVDGSYSLTVKTSNDPVKIIAGGFQTKLISHVRLNAHDITELDIMMAPAKKNDKLTDSAQTLFQQNSSPGLNTSNLLPGIADRLHGNAIAPGTDKDAGLLLKRLRHVAVVSHPFQLFSQSLVVNGMTERNNQFLLNGLPVSSPDPLQKSFIFSGLPSESLAEATVQTIPDATIPPDFTGGSVQLTTSSIPHRNFVYVLAGAGAFNGNLGKTSYLNDKLQAANMFGFTGKEVKLPGNFPAIRSRQGFNDYNLQARMDFAKQLNNRFLPDAYTTSIPNNRFMFGLGRLINLNGGNQLGLLLYVQQQKAERIDMVHVQAAPDVKNNPYPFNPSSPLPLIMGASADSVYRFASMLSAQSALTYKTKQFKITWRNVFLNQLENNFSKRSQLFKPSEDTLARFGLHYYTAQYMSVNSQLDGLHLLNRNSDLSLEWKTNYEYVKLQQPDERNILLHQSPGNGSEYRLAAQSDFSRNTDYVNFLNSGRSWRNTQDHNFNASVQISFPVRAFGTENFFKGGFFLQTNYRVFYSDLFLLRNAGDTRFYSPDNFLAPARFYPEGIVVESFYGKIPSDQLQTSAFNARQANLGNYTGSLNTGAAFAQVNSRLSDKLIVDWGVRFESANQLVSNTQYEYEETLEDFRLFTLNLNSRVTHTYLLPNVKLSYAPVNYLRLFAAYAKTVYRPQMRELANYTSHQPGLFMVHTGNPILESSAVHHYNGGLQFPIAAQSDFSIGGFYKIMERPVENVIDNYASGYLSVTPVNVPRVYVSGLQMALKLNLYSLIKTPFFSYVSLFANGNFSSSNATSGLVKGRSPAYKRSFSGVPGYVWSTGLTINHPGYPNLSFVFQETDDMIHTPGSGERLLLSNGNTVSATPELRQARQRQMDLQLSQKFFKSSLQIIAGVNNVLQPDYILYQDLNGNKSFDKALNISLRNNGGYYLSGTDNTLVRMKTQRQFYVTLSFLFK